MSSKILAAAVVLLASRAEAAGWSKQARGEFIGGSDILMEMYEAGAAPKQNITEASAQVYCGCVADLLERKYDERQFENEGVTRSAGFNADVQSATQSCAKNVQFARKPGQKGWSPTFRSAFVGSCVGGATGKGADEKKAHKYCTCRGNALEKRYDENQFTQASFQPSDRYNADLEGAAKVCVKDLR